MRLMSLMHCMTSLKRSSPLMTSSTSTRNLSILACRSSIACSVLSRSKSPSSCFHSHACCFIPCRSGSRLTLDVLKKRTNYDHHLWIADFVVMLKIVFSFIILNQKMISRIYSFIYLFIYEMCHQISLIIYMNIPKSKIIFIFSALSNK